MDTPGCVFYVDTECPVSVICRLLARSQERTLQARNLKSAQGSKQYGSVPEWLKGTGCKPVGYAYLGSNPSAPTIMPM